MAKVFRCQMFRYYSRGRPKLKSANNQPEPYSKHTSEIIQHYEKSELFKQNFQFLSKKYFIKKKCTPPAMIIADEFVAKEIVSAIKDDLKSSKDPVFEANPGLGFITRELLKLDIPKICLFEWESSFKNSSPELFEKYGDRLKFYNTNILELWKLTFLDKLDKGGRLKGIMEHVPIKEWEDEPVIRIFGALPSMNFINTVISSIVFRHGITTYGRPEMFIIISSVLYHRLYNPNWGNEFLFSMFFDWKFIMDIDKHALLPWTVNKSTKKIKIGFNPDKYYLLKAVPKRDLYHRVPPDLMKPLWYFSKLVLRGRRLRILPSLEKWIPGCGPRLIAKGVGAYTELSELTPEKILEIFLDFTNWPEFSSSCFLSSMEDYLMKSETESEESFSSDAVNVEEIVTEPKGDEQLEIQT